MLGALWDDLRREWKQREDEDRPPVFILVCKNTRIAKVIYEWLAEDKPPAGIPSARLPELRNRNGQTVTIRVDTKVVQESDADNAKSDEVARMRRTLDTVGKRQWPLDPQGRPIYPEEFAELAQKLSRPLTPPGRDVRCIVSVGMLTEGWDCNTVTRIIGLRMSQCGNGAVQKARIIAPVTRATVVLIEVGSCARALWARPKPTTSVTQLSASITTFRCGRRQAAKNGS